jgi:uncharacterized small protein (DUF1192 family)
MNRSGAGAKDRKKREKSRQDQQFVDNTSSAQQAREKSLATPLNEYAELSVGEIQRRIQGLADAEVERVREYESRHKSRKTLLEALEKRLAD